MSENTIAAEPRNVVVLDREREFRMDLNACIEFEEITGKSLTGGFAAMGLSDVRVEEGKSDHVLSCVDKM